jgi:hypothetical protein
MDEAYGLDFAINWNLVLINRHKSYHAYDDAHLHRSNNPGAWPLTPFTTISRQRKRPRLEASTGSSSVEDAADADTFFDAQTTITVTTTSPDDTVDAAPT